MHKLLLLLFMLPLFAFGQPGQFPTGADLERSYTQAISDFIKAANKKNRTPFDTLFFGRHINGQPDDFPAIDLPGTIQNTVIQLITPEAGKKTQADRKSRIYINLFGWFSKGSAEFLFVIFSNGFSHQYDYSINYKYNAKQKVFELQKIQVKGPPFHK